MTHPACMMNHSSFTAQRGESNCACASFFLLILAGIVAAMSVLFISVAVFSLRVCVLLWIVILVQVLVLAHITLFPTAPKEHVR